MVDHVFLEVVRAVRDAFDAALLEHHTTGDHFLADVLAGDLTWEATHSLPGEPSPPRVRADLVLEWPTWSQTAWRCRMVGGTTPEPPEVSVELVLRVQQLATRPDLDTVLCLAPEEGPVLADDTMERVCVSVEDAVGREPDDRRHSVELAFEGCYRLEDLTGSDQRLRLQADFSPLAAWVASNLVRLSDLHLEFLPPAA